MRPAELIRGATPKARSRAVGSVGTSAERASSARSPGRDVVASSARPSRTMARLSPVMGAMSAMVPMAATPARSAADRPRRRSSADASLKAIPAPVRSGSG